MCVCVYMHASHQAAIRQATQREAYAYLRAKTKCIKLNLVLLIYVAAQEPWGSHLMRRGNLLKGELLLPCLSRCLGAAAVEQVDKVSWKTTRSS